MQRNRLEVVGYLAAKPAIRHLPSGTPVANVRLGESYRYQDGDGTTKQQTNWHNLSFYGDLSRIAMTFEKGDRLFVEGTVEQRQFTPKGDGSQRTVHEVVVRSCLPIAAPRGNRPPSVQNPITPDLEEGVADNESWPVG